MEHNNTLSAELQHHIINMKYRGHPKITWTIQEGLHRATLRSIKTLNYLYQIIRAWQNLNQISHTPETGTHNKPLQLYSLSGRGRKEGVGGGGTKQKTRQKKT